MAKIKKQYQHKTIDGIRVVISIGREYWFEIGKNNSITIGEWKNRNLKEIEAFIKSIDPELWDKRNHKLKTAKKDNKR